MEQILYNYIKLDLDTSENLLIATIKRASRVAQIIKLQEELKDQTEYDRNMQLKELQDKILKDQHDLNTNMELRKTLYKEANFEKEIISFSCMVKKLNKKNEQLNTLFVISNFG